MAPILRFGIAGLGLATTFTLPDMATHPRVRISAAADLRPEARQRFESEFGGRTFESVAELCASPLVDAVYVCTPNYLHAEHVMLAIQNGKHVIVEKPIALSLAECDTMNEAAVRAGVQVLSGHTHGFDPPIRKMRELIEQGDLGRLRMAHSWNYTDFNYRPRLDWEMETARGGGVVFTQAPHQVEILRLLGGGLVRSVRAMTGNWDAARPTEGTCVAYLEFEDGAPATLVYSGYGHFDSAELHFQVGERGQERPAEANARTLAAYRTRTDAATGDEEARNGLRYAGGQQRGHGAASGFIHQPFFGLSVASCARADMRQSPDGLYVYGEKGRTEIDLSQARGANAAMVDEFCAAVDSGEPPLHDGHWAEATVEVCLAILQSARERREIFLKRQVPVRH